MGAYKAALERIPLSALDFLSHYVRGGYLEPLDEVRLRKFLLSHELYIAQQRKKRICEIKTLEYDYKLFNICFFENVAKNVLYSLANDSIPILTFTSSTTGTNLWNDLFSWPFSLPEEGAKRELCAYTSAPVYFPGFPNARDIELISKLYHLLWQPNSKTRAYFDDEYDDLIKGKKVLGVLSRGTDYLVTKPKNHPIQPSTEELITKAQEVAEKGDYDYIYLATEESAVEEKFNAAFPGRIIVNKRHYFDKYYKLSADRKRVLIADVNTGRENDEYWKSLEYLSSVNLLSKCDGLVAGCCGGSRAALYVNNGAYQTWYLFNKGVYS